MLKIFDQDNAKYVDEMEVGERLSGPVRFALQVPHINAALERALAHGGKLVHEPVENALERSQCPRPGAGWHADHIIPAD